MPVFLMHLQHYLIDIIPSIFLGFLISGIVHEFLPQSFIEKNLSHKGIMPLIYVIISGIILPGCCFAALPVAITFRKKGVPLGPVLAFLIAEPATSLPAILVTWKFMGPAFTVFLCTGVVFLGFVIGLIGNLFDIPEVKEKSAACPMCAEHGECHENHQKNSLKSRITSVLSYSFIDMPKEIGVEIIIGILLAALISSVSPVEYFIKNYLSGFAGYMFALIFGLVMYICSTASVPLVHALVQKGLSLGAGMVLLLAGPITSYGTILVVKKEFGMKILLVYLAVISFGSLFLGYAFSYLFP